MLRRAVPLGATCAILVLIYSVQAEFSTKVDQRLFTEGKSLEDIVVFFGSDQEFKDIVSQVSVKYHNATRENRIYNLHQVLSGYSTKSQNGAKSFLTSKGYTFTDYWASNAVVVKKADAECVKSLASFQDVQTITKTATKMRKDDRNIPYQPVEPSPDNSAPGPFSIGTSWPLSIMRVPEAWGYETGLEKAKTGRGVLVGQISTGVYKEHETLKHNFRRVNGWADGLNPGNNVPFDSDDLGPGTGTAQMGLAVGSLRIGVAPGAEWMACRGCRDSDNCDISALLFCCQWMVCPYDHSRFPNGPSNYRDCTGTPDIVIGTWVIEPEDASNIDNRCINPIREVGMIPMFAGWTRGPECGTIVMPASFPDVIAIGATNANDELYYYSGRGPAYDGRVQPDVVAPGEDVVVPAPGAPDAYGNWSGTVSASGYAAGVAALMLERYPASYDIVAEVLRNTAEFDHLGQTTQVCGGLKSSDRPNNLYGAGRVNALEAVKEMVKLRPSFRPPRPPFPSKL